MTTPAIYNFQAYIQEWNDITARSLLYYIVLYIVAKEKTNPEFKLHSASYRIIFFASINMGIPSKNYVCNSAQVIYYIAYTLSIFLHFLVKTDSEVI